MDSKCLSPFKILDLIGESKLTFKLNLLLHWRIHSMFHVSLLEPYHPNCIEGQEQQQPPPPPPEVIEGETEYNVKEVLDSRIRHGKLEYLVDWVGYLLEERTWELAENLLHANEAVATFHRHYLQQPVQGDIPNHSRRSSRTRRGGTVIRTQTSHKDRN